MKSKYLECLFWVALIFLISIGCRPSKELITPPLALLSNAYLNAHLENTNNDYEWIKLKARISYKDTEQSFKGTVHIRSKKDSLMWIRISKLGIEGARMLISKDSIKMANRFDKTYEISAIDTRDQDYGLKLTLGLLQDALVANPIRLDSSNYESSTDATGYIMHQENLNSSLTYHLLPNNLWVDWLNVERIDEGQIHVIHSDFDSSDSTFVIPKKRIITGKDKNNNSVHIEFKIVNYELGSPTKMTFNIPPHYVLKK